MIAFVSLMTAECVNRFLNRSCAGETVFQHELRSREAERKISKRVVARDFLFHCWKVRDQIRSSLIVQDDSKIAFRAQIRATNAGRNSYEPEMLGS